MGAYERVGVVPVAAGAVTSPDHHYVYIALGNQGIRKRHVCGPGAYDELIRLDHLHELTTCLGTR